MRDQWTDERLDDLKDSMHREFDRVHREFDRVHREFDQVHRRFDQVHGEFDQVRAEIGGLRAETNARFEALDRKLYFGWGSIIVTLVGAVFAKGLF